MKIRTLLEAAERKFPIAAMGPDFKGKHNLTLTDNADGKPTLMLTLWAHGQAWPLFLDAEEEAKDDSLVEQLMEDISQTINRRREQNANRS